MSRIYYNELIGIVNIRCLFGQRLTVCRLFGQRLTACRLICRLQIFTEDIIFSAIILNLTPLSLNSDSGKSLPHIC